jgi:hypothetical protein
MKRTGVTIIEILIGAVIMSVLLGAVYQVFHLLFSRDSRHSLTSLTQRSFIQKDMKVGLRRLIYRLREGIQIVEPLPGQGGNQIVFRDVTNLKIRIRRHPERNQLISEREQGGTWVLEEQPTLVDTDAGSLPASFPVRMDNCWSAHFTAQSPECVSLRVTVEQEGQQGTFMTVVKLRNSNLAY